MKQLFATVASLAFSAAFLCISGCEYFHPDYDVALPNGYLLARCNPYDIAIFGPPERGRTRVIPPRVARLGVREDFIFGKVEASNDPWLEDNDPRARDEKAGQEKARGYFLINTKTHAVRLGLSKDAWLAVLQDNGISEEPKLKKPSRWFRY